MPNDERRRAVERARDRGRLGEADDWQQARATRRDVPPERPGSTHECACCSRPRHAGRLIARGSDARLSCLRVGTIQAIANTHPASSRIKPPSHPNESTVYPTTALSTSEPPK